MTQNIDNEEFMTITRGEYILLLKSAKWVECLDIFGVSDWEGYGDASELYRESNESKLEI